MISHAHLCIQTEKRSKDMDTRFPTQAPTPTPPSVHVPCPQSFILQTHPMKFHLWPQHQLTTRMIGLLDILQVAGRKIERQRTHYAGSTNKENKQMPATRAPAEDSIFTGLHIYTQGSSRSLRGLSYSPWRSWRPRHPPPLAA